MKLSTVVTLYALILVAFVASLYMIYRNHNRDCVASYLQGRFSLNPPQSLYAADKLLASKFYVGVCTNCVKIIIQEED